MEKYLDFVKNKIIELSKDDTTSFIKELEMYKNVYLHYKNIWKNTPYNNSNVNYNKHIFNLPPDREISLSWNIDLIYHDFLSVVPIYIISLTEFHHTFEEDINHSQVEFNELFHKITTIQEHRYRPILGIYFKPMHQNLILDGRHRYTELLKFAPSHPIELLYLDSTTVINSLLTPFDLVKYIILNNIEEIHNYLFGDKTIKNMLHFSDYNL